MKTAYHFTASTLRDGSPVPPIGQWLEHVGPVIPCRSGLHASEHPFDALQFAPGPMLHLVELDGEILTHGNPVDKLVASRRRVVASIDATELLRTFAHRQALSVAHLWDMPPEVREYMATGNAALRAAAWSAARSAAEDAAWSAAEDAARSAAWSAARSAARSAAEAAAWSATRSATREMFAEMVNEAFARK